LQSAAAGAQPRWLSCGGDVRRLVVLNVDEAAEAWSPSCEQAVGGAATVIRDPRESALVCVAAEHIPLREIAAKLAEGRSEVLQLADRLLTRTDVPWSPLG
jgi:hypothetical protein